MINHEGAERPLPLLDYVEAQARAEAIRNLTHGAHPVGKDINGDIVYSRPVGGGKVELFTVGESLLTKGKLIVFGVKASEVTLDSETEADEVKCEICNGQHASADHK